MKRLAFWLAIAVSAFSLISVSTTQAAEAYTGEPSDESDEESTDRFVILQSGMCGDNVAYQIVLDKETDTVTLSCFVISIPGSCCIDSYSSADEQPWAGFQSVIDYVYTSGVIETGSYCFAEFVKCQEFCLDECMISIGHHSLAKCTSVMRMIIPDSTVVIANYAFAGDRSLKSVVFGAGLRSIGKNAFAKCNLQELNLPSKLRSIGKYAFTSNKELKCITFGRARLVLNDYAFSNCVSLGVPDVPNWVVCRKGVFRNCR